MVGDGGMKWLREGIFGVEKKQGVLCEGRGQNLSEKSSGCLGRRDGVVVIYRRPD